jgi:hypothetical protein
MNELEQIKEILKEIQGNKHELYFKYNIYFIRNFSITVKTISDRIDTCLLCKQTSSSLLITGKLKKMRNIYVKNQPPIKYFAHISICENEKCKKYRNCSNYGPYFHVYINNDNSEHSPTPKGSSFFDKSVSLHELTMFYKPTLYYLTIKDIIKKIKSHYKFNDSLFIKLKEILPKDIFNDIIYYLERLYAYFPHFLIIKILIYRRK